MNEWNNRRKIDSEILEYNIQRKIYINDYRSNKITTDTLDQLERDLSTAHLERLRKIRKGY